MRDMFERLAARFPDAQAGWRAGESVSHAALMARVRAWATLGRRAGPGPVALYHDDSLEFAAALVGAWLAGKAVWLPADVLPATCAALAGNVDAFWGDFPGTHAPQAPDGTDDAGIDWRTPAPDFPALVVFTSGTTGTPVPITKRFSQLTSELDALETQFGAALGAADVVATVSHQHIYGLLFRVLWPLAAGRPVHAARHEYPETLAPALAVRPCVLLASPAHLKRLPDHLDWRGAAANLRAVFSSGGMLDEAAAHHAGALLGRTPIEVYGSSETGGIAWRQRTDTGDEGWTALPGVAWRRDADGLLAVRSAQAGTDDWLVLADRIDDLDDGRFALRGRADRIVKIEEKRISLDAIETALLAGGLAREARVLACADGGHGRQVLAAFVVPSAVGRAVLEEGGKTALNTRLRAQLASGVDAVALPRRWRYLDALPVDARGKTTAAQLLALLDPAPARPRHPTVRVLEQGDARVLLELTVPADLLYFDGHFDVAPVLPGVVQVDWAIHYGAHYLGRGGSFAGIQALKFQQMIRPEQPVRLELSRDAAKGSLAFRYFSEAGAHASGRILFGPDQPC
ncbi:AMP-binding protein [Telluria mixta]|uniref:AMP-binding protein n=1 Tax=Telluria mixta TaxID=34071 RepID=A0ABT2BRW1_9BURK|nr:AMP-binding protein [Telluria mixta]MCS0627855.1 AMP-binding protein [Telluria mixta]WEM94026.1 AMP-binding protein [Telluria mixta]